MSVVLQPGTVIQYKNASGAVHAGTLLQQHNVVTGTWDLIAWSSAGVAALHSAVGLDQTRSANNTFSVLSGSVPF